MHRAGPRLPRRRVREKTEKACLRRQGRRTLRAQSSAWLLRMLNELACPGVGSCAEASQSDVRRRAGCQSDCCTVDTRRHDGRISIPATAAERLLSRSTILLGGAQLFVAPAGAGERGQTSVLDLVLTSRTAESKNAVAAASSAARSAKYSVLGTSLQYTVRRRVYRPRHAADDSVMHCHVSTTVSLSCTATCHEEPRQ